MRVFFNQKLRENTATENQTERSTAIMATKKQSAKTFESQLQELETIVEAMEEGDLPLEDALKQFEQGVKLTKNCQQLLEKAKQRIQVLSEQQELVDLDVDINEDEDAD